MGIDFLKVAVAQVVSDYGQPHANLQRAESVLHTAHRRRIQLVVFPECFVHGYPVMRQTARIAEAASGRSIRSLCAIARSVGIAVIAGFIERNPAGGRPFNAAAVVAPNGELVGTYRKTHLFGAEVSIFAAGDAYPVFTVKLNEERTLKLGVAICADVEFPEVVRLLAIGGAELVAVLSADMDPYRQQQAANLRSRAIENNLYVALANTVGERDGLWFFGGSGIASPTGRLVSSGYDREVLTAAVLRQEEIDRSGGVQSNLQKRRVDTYGALLSQEPDI